MRDGHGHGRAPRALPATPCRPTARSDAPSASSTSPESPELLGERAGQGRVLGQHVVDVTVARDRELQPRPEPVQRWLAGPDPPYPGDRAAQAAELVGVLVRLQRDVVAEPLRLLVRIGVAPDVDQQRGRSRRRPARRRPGRADRPGAATIRHWRSTCSIGWPNPRSIPRHRAATSSARRTPSRRSPSTLEASHARRSRRGVQQDPPSRAPSSAVEAVTCADRARIRCPVCTVSEGE